MITSVVDAFQNILLDGNVTTQSFLGQDKMMWVEKAFRHRNAIFVRVKLDGTNQVRKEELYHNVVSRVCSYIESGGPKGVCRARWCDFDEKRYFFSEDSSASIASQLVIYRDTHLSDTDISYMIVRYPVRWIVGRNSYVCVASHQFVDGCKCSELASVPLDNMFMDWNMIPKMKYVPGFTELIISPSIPAIISMLPEMRRHLTINSSWRYEDSKNIHRRSRISGIKLLKQYLSDMFGKFGFTQTVATLSCLDLLLHTDKKRLSVGITGAFRDDNFWGVFNKFAVAGFVIVRHEHFNIMDIMEKLHDIARQLKNSFSTIKSQMTATYVATNVYLVNPEYVLDCLISNSPILKEGKFLGKPVRIKKILIPGTSMPVYYGWWTSGPTINNVVILRTDEYKTVTSSTTYTDEIISRIGNKKMRDGIIQKNRIRTCK